MIVQTQLLHHQTTAHLSSKPLTLFFIVILANVSHGFNGFKSFSRLQRYNGNLVTKKRHLAIVDAEKRSTITTNPIASTKIRQNRVQNLMEWSDKANIKISKQVLSFRNDDATGFGLYSTGNIPIGSILMSVPADIALSVECPGEGPNNREVIATYGNDIKNLPWFAQMSLYVNILRKQQSGVYQDWIATLPNKFDTPFHWNAELLDDLQYDHLANAVKRQKTTWKSMFDSISSKSSLSYQEFIWGCECARSRAFSGTYTGNAFNPKLYSFLLLLMTIYVGLNVGTLEQASNGAVIVVCASIFNDFVLPKIFKRKKFVVCPLIDIVNHQSASPQGDVAFEYFGNSYSLAISKNSNTIKPNDQIFISYGNRSNDQLLQYYGFVEADNPHDIYVMPPLCDWDISAIENATGRQIEAGRLSLLNQAGLLGVSPETRLNDDSDEVLIAQQGVILSTATGVDPAVLQALRVLVATKGEWEANGEGIGNFLIENSGGLENERCARIAAMAAIEKELACKPTTLQEDVDALSRMENVKSMSVLSDEEILVLKFRVQKKKILQKCIDLMK